MHLTSCLLWTLAAISFARGQDDDDEAETLTLKPLGAEHLKAVDGTMFFTCEVENAKENAIYQISWTNSNGADITDTSGSSRMYVEEEGNAIKKLYITKIVEGDAGVYTCTATINGQRVKKSAQIKIFKDISFDAAPELQYPKIHTDALIQCEVSGNPLPEVTWRKGPSTKKLSTGSGATSKYKVEAGKGLRIRNITQEDNGQYICRAEVTADGRYSSRTITVEVHIPPAISKPPGRVEGVEGGNATMTCSANGLPKPKFEFIKAEGGKKVEPNDRIVIDNDAGTLKFVKLSKLDQGAYTCRALNDAGNDSAEGQLHVFVKPKIFELQSLVKVENERATLICRSEGDPVPELLFRKANLTDIVDGDDKRITVKQIGSELTLSISSLTPNDSASYSCQAKNAYGTDYKSGSITVEYKPRMVAGQSNVMYTWAGRPEGSNISCHATGEPAPTYTWTTKGGALRSMNTTFHVHNKDGISYLQVSVRDVDQSWVYAEYSCNARNKHGNAEYKFELRRAVPPSNPVNITVDNLSPTTADLLIVPGETGGMPIIKYVVEYDKTVLEYPADQPVVLKNLKSSTNYTVQVKAKNEVGTGGSFKLTFVTEQMRRPYAIKISSDARGSKPNEYSVEWEVPNTGGSPITRYRVRHRQVKLVKVNNNDSVQPVGDWSLKFHPDTELQPQVKVQLKDLQPLTSYEVEIVAENAMGMSDLHKPFIFTTSEAAPVSQSRNRGAALHTAFVRHSSFVVFICMWTLIVSSHA